MKLWILQRPLVRLVLTTSSLKFYQIVSRLRLRAYRMLLTYKPDYMASMWDKQVLQFIGWPSQFQAIIPFDITDAHSIESIENRQFCFLNESVTLGTKGFGIVNASQLWRYNLHYFEWALILHQRHPEDSLDKLFLEVWTQWCSETKYGKWDEWSPYVVSLRLWVLCSLCSSFNKLLVKDSFLNSIVSHGCFLTHNLETDVGGNHLIKNIKALIGYFVFIGNSDDVKRFSDKLDSEIRIQIMEDGGHYEMSPSYHCQVLGDLIDVSNLLNASGYHQSELLTSSIESMRKWASIMLMPDNSVPLFNDSVVVPGSVLKQLGVKRETSVGMYSFKDSGYVVVKLAQQTQYVIDVGQPCPKQLPAHAQADALSVVCYVNGKHMLVDSGVSTYVGSRRDYERSTKAHSTLEIAGVNQSDVYGSFRVGYRANVNLLNVQQTSSGYKIEGSHDGYKILKGKPLHRRTFEIGTDAFVVSDSIHTTLRHPSILRWVFDSECELWLENDNRTVVITSGGLEVARMRAEEIVEGGKYELSEKVFKVRSCLIASNFGVTQESSLVECMFNSDGSGEIKTYIDFL